MTETTIPTSLTPTGQVSAPELARAAGLNPVDYLRRRGFVYDITDEDGLREAFDEGTVTYYQGSIPPDRRSMPVTWSGSCCSRTCSGSVTGRSRSVAVARPWSAIPVGRTSSRELITLEELDANISGIMIQLGKYLDFDGGRFGDNPAAMLVNNADWLLDLATSNSCAISAATFRSTRCWRRDVQDAAGNDRTELRRVQLPPRPGVRFPAPLPDIRLPAPARRVRPVGQYRCRCRTDPQGRRREVACARLPADGDLDRREDGQDGSGVRVWLDPERFSPYDYYQYWINTDDSQVESHLRRFTFLVDDVIDEITSVEGEALREAKRVLAYEATALAHGVDAAEQAESAAKSLFSRGSGPSADDETLPTTEIAGFERDNEPLKLADAFIEAGLVKSRGEARRLAQSNGLSIDDSKVTDVDITLREAIGDRTAVLLRSGKKNFKRVVILNRDA